MSQERVTDSARWSDAFRLIFSRNSQDSMNEGLDIGQDVVHDGRGVL